MVDDKVGTDDIREADWPLISITFYIFGLDGLWMEVTSTTLGGFLSMLWKWRSVGLGGARQPGTRHQFLHLSFGHSRVLTHEVVWWRWNVFVPSVVPLIHG